MKKKTAKRKRGQQRVEQAPHGKIQGTYKLFTSAVEPGAMDQFLSAMRQDFSEKGALMPDAHMGYSLPIGGVVATKGMILPAWVGYDIGCGMCAYRTDFTHDQMSPFIREIYTEIYQGIPTGFNHHKSLQNWKPGNHLSKTPVLKSIYEKKGLIQLGTLGSGNHFIEIGKDESNRVWIIVHSGSRGVGHAVATHYMKLASGGTKAREGHFGFSVNSENGQNYVTDMNFCLEFALENRKKMLEKVHNILSTKIDKNVTPIDQNELINRNHNHAEFHEGLWIHRKGATQAHRGMKGVVPGNMRDGSFIVEGLGNPESLWSSSHGAGRVMSRRKAKSDLNLEEFKKTMEGIQAKVTPSTLDESPFAYKDIFEVMKSQDSMVNVLHHVVPIINIKA